MAAAPEGRLRPSLFAAIVALTDNKISFEGLPQLLRVTLERGGVTGVVFGNGAPRRHAESNPVQYALR